MHITKFVIHVTKFVTHVRNFVTNFFCADSKKYQAERENYLPDNKKRVAQNFDCPPPKSIFWFYLPRFSPFREHKTRPGSKIWTSSKDFQWNTIQWNGRTVLTLPLSISWNCQKHNTSLSSVKQKRATRHRAARFFVALERELNYFLK